MEEAKIIKMIVDSIREVQNNRSSAIRDIRIHLENLYPNTFKELEKEFNKDNYYYRIKSKVSNGENRSMQEYSYYKNFIEKDLTITLKVFNNIKLSGGRKKGSMGKRINEEAIINLYNQGVKKSDISRIMEISRPTINRVLKDIK